MRPSASDPLWYLSFVDPEKIGPEGTHWLGAVIVRAQDITTAAAAAWELGINPGGEVIGHQVPDDAIIPNEYLNTLLDKAGVERATGGPAKTLREAVRDGNIPEESVHHHHCAGCGTHL